MKIKDGRSYRTRAGMVVKVQTNQSWQVNSNRFPFVSYRDGEVFEWYTNEGRVHLPSGFAKDVPDHVDDLIEEVEPQIDVDLSLPEAVHTVLEFDEEDREDVWAAFTNNVGTMDFLIAARKQLNKA